MRCFKSWLQALAGGMAMCIIMLALIAVACVALVFTTALALVLL
jgi:signal transduction histidine kinase